MKILFVLLILTTVILNSLSKLRLNITYYKFYPFTSYILFEVCPVRFDFYGLTLVVNILSVLCMVTPFRFII